MHRSTPALRLRRVDDTPTDDQFEDLRPDEPPPADPPPNRRPVIIGVSIFVLGCLLLAGCLLIYSLTRSTSETAQPSPTTAAALSTEPAAPTETESPTEIVLQPTDDLTATALAAIPTLPPVRFATLSEIVGEVRTRATADEAWALVTADSPLAPGGTVLTGQDSRVKITLAEGSIIRLSSQTQFTLVEAGGTDSDPLNRMLLDFGKIWAIVTQPLNTGVFEIQLPVGVAAVRGSFLSAEFNSTTNGIVVSCLEGQCHYENTNGAADFTALQQAVSVNGAAPNVQPISANQLNDWNPGNVPEVQILTPTATETPIPTETPPVTPSFTPTPSRTPIPTNTARPTRTLTNTRTPTLTRTPSATPTVTLTPGPTATIGPAAKLAFTIQPSTSVNGVAFQVEVAIQDESGTLVTDATQAVSLAIGSNGGGAILAGATTVGPVNGLAKFQVSLDKAGTYTLVASAPGLTSATSAAFNINGSNALLLVINGLPNEVTVGQAITITVKAIESGGSVSTNYLGTIRFQSSDGQALLPPDYSFSAVDQGIHTFTVTFNTTGSQSLKVFDTFIPALNGFAGTTVR